MKKTLLALAILASAVAAQAGTIGFIENKAGGNIQFTDGTSTRCQELSRTTGEPWFYAVSVTDTGDAIRGCWALHSDDQQVEVRWGSDVGYKTKIYPNSSVVRTAYYYKLFPNKSTRTSGGDL